MEKLIILFTLFLSPPIYAQKQKKDDKKLVYKITDGIVSFNAIGNPGFLRIDGEGGKLSGQLVDKGGKVSGEIKSTLDFKTGIDLRDNHLREKYLEVKKYGISKLVLKDLPYKLKEVFPFEGFLTIKKDTKKVKGTALLIDNKLVADFDMKLWDFPSIGSPSWLGVSVAEDVSVHVEANFEN